MEGLELGLIERPSDEQFNEAKRTHRLSLLPPMFDADDAEKLAAAARGESVECLVEAGLWWLVAQPAESRFSAVSKPLFANTPVLKANCWKPVYSAKVIKTHAIGKFWEEHMGVFETLWRKLDGKKG